MSTVFLAKDVTFPKRTQLYDIPAQDRNHVFSVFGADAQMSAVNLNTLEPNGVLNGSLSFSSEGLLALGSTNSIRFTPGRALSGQACTLMVAFKTLGALGNAGLVNLWSKGSTVSDPLQRRIFLASGGATDKAYDSVPVAQTPSSSRQIQPSTIYLLSMTRGAKGIPSVLRLHAKDGSVLSSSALAESGDAQLNYAADTVFDVGPSITASQTGAYIKGAALWTGLMSETEISAAAKKLYSICYP